jgi:hypothetical protein
VTVILPSDAAYRRAKRVRQGGARLDPRLAGVVTRFEDRFGLQPLWLGFDVVARHDAPHPWLRAEVVLERTRQYRRFCRSAFAYDPDEQRLVAEILLEELGVEGLCTLFDLPADPGSWRPRITDVFGCFSDFERVAKAEVHPLVTEDELAQFSASVATGEGGVGDALWRVHGWCGSPVVFVHTDEQAAELRGSPVRARWADDYFALLRRHDEFGYQQRSEITIEVDSKETSTRSTRATCTTTSSDPRWAAWSGRRGVGRVGRRRGVRPCA